MLCCKNDCTVSRSISRLHCRHPIAEEEELHDSDRNLNITSPVDIPTAILESMWLRQQFRQNMCPHGSLRMLHAPSNGLRQTGHSLTNVTAWFISADISRALLNRFSLLAENLHKVDKTISRDPAPALALAQLLPLNKLLGVPVQVMEQNA